MGKKIYTIVEETSYTSRQYRHSGTLDELVSFYQGTLERGSSWAFKRKSNKSVNTNPKTIASLLTNLNRASHNFSVNGCGSSYYQE